MPVMRLNHAVRYVRDVARTRAFYEEALGFQTPVDAPGRRAYRPWSLVGSSDHGTTKSLYARDPDGNEFEVVWIIPVDLLSDDAPKGRSTIRPLDIEREIERYGAATVGGVGISHERG